MNESAPGPGPGKVANNQTIFPIFSTNPGQKKLDHSSYLGTGFFVSRRGLALTAAHVLESAGDGKVLIATVPGFGEVMRGYSLAWAVQLPDSDIAVFRLDTGDSASLLVDFREIYLNETVSTTGIPKDAFEESPDGKVEIHFRAAQGYVAFGRKKWMAASFALPAGMSGSPAVARSNGRVVGVMVGQHRTEIDEHLVKEFTEPTPTGQATYVEKISRVEYSARIDLLWQHRDFRAAEFGGLTLTELIESENRTPDGEVNPMGG
jgi:hypothetical protein